MKYRALLSILAALFGLLIAFVVDRSGADVESFGDTLRARTDVTLTPDPSILLVGIDDLTMEYGLFRREVHAHILKVLKEAGARLVFFDVIFDEDREPDTDRELAESIMDWPAVVLAGSTTTTEEGHILAPHLAPALQDAVDSGSALLGGIEKFEDPDGVLRVYLLAISMAQDGEIVARIPSAALVCYSLLQSSRPEDIEYRRNELLLPPVPIPVISDVQKGAEGQTLLIQGFPVRFHTPATGPDHKPGADTYDVISYADLIEPSDQVLEKLKGAVVIIGENTNSESDLVVTSAGTMKGFEAHAQCLDRLLHHDFYGELGPQTTNNAALILIVLTASLGLQTLPLPLLLGLGLSLPALYSGLDLWLYQEKHLKLGLTAPVIGSLATLAFLVVVRLLLTSRFLGRFIPVEASQGLLTSKRLSLKGRATVIVTDIRGYTTISETKTPLEMLKLLNEYHSITVDIYHKHGGNVLTFQGDAQLVVFGYPKKLKDPVSNAVDATWEVMEAIAELRKKWGIDDPANFDVGAGICTGDVYIGDIGSKEQANYTVIGEVVRTSHKVQSQSTALEGNVLLDQAAYKACKNKPEVTPFPGIELDGFPEPRTLYRVDKPRRS